MAMKVTKKTIHRLSVETSCGCSIYAEFADSQCKHPLGGFEIEDSPIERVFKVCSKHEGDAAISMLEFVLIERLDEAIVDAQKTPATPQHLHSLPIADGDTGGVPGGQSVAKVNRPAAVTREHPEGGPTIKTKTRSTEQLAKSGALLNASSTDVMIAGGESEDEDTTDDLTDILAEFDPTANEG